MLRRIARKVRSLTGGRADRLIKKQLQEACPIPGGKMMWADGIKMEPDFCQPLNEPKWVTGSDASHMRPSDPILGVADETGAWALPWWIMKNHHVANLDLAGRPRTIIFCELCVTGGLYDPVIDGTRYRWAVTGVADGVTIMRDDQTGSLWHSLTMDPIHGPAVGTARPQRLPLVQSRWDEWLDAHPDTQVAFDRASARKGHGSQVPAPDHRGRRFQDTKKRPDDDRLDQVSLVLGVDTGSAQSAYPLEALAQEGGIVNDTVGGLSIVAVHRPGTWIATAFEREWNGHTLNLGWDGPHLVDAESGGRWSEVGMPIDGTSESLRFVPGGLEKWHAWSGTHPDAALFGHERVS